MQLEGGADRTVFLTSTSKRFGQSPELLRALPPQACLSPAILSPHRAGSVPELFSGVRLPTLGCLGMAENKHDLEMRYNALEREADTAGSAHSPDIAYCVWSLEQGLGNERPEAS